MALRLDPSTIPKMRAWAALDEFGWFVVRIDGYSIALFKEDIDAASTDEMVVQLLQDRLGKT